MRLFFLSLLFAVAFAGTQVLSQAPPVGSGGQVQATKTGNYTIKSTDLKTTIPFNCSAACTATMPQSTASWPKGYAVRIMNAGTTTVTVHATPTSTFFGMVPAGTADILLTAQGNWVDVTANAANNYLASGAIGVPTPPASFLALGVGGGNALGVGSGNALGVQ